MASPGWRGRLILVSVTIGVIAAAVALVCACTGPRPAAAGSPRPVPAGGSPRRAAGAQSPRREVRAQPAVGAVGSYRVGERRLTFVERARPGPAGQELGQRTLATLIRYPLPVPSAGLPGPARGPFPLLMFAPGFLQCGGPYSRLLRAWASAGYVVAVVSFPRTDCHVGAAADEADLVNQPGDVSYVISRLLVLSARPGGPLSGLLNQHEIAAAGQSDGGDTVAALAASTCCADHRLAAAAVLSGAEWPPMPGRYFAHRAPPLLFVQGSADVINPPWMSRQLYAADSRRARYYLDLLGANHLIPYLGTNPVERLVARVTLAFFDRYVLRQAGAAAAMSRAGNVRGEAELASGGQLPP